MYSAIYPHLDHRMLLPSVHSIRLHNHQQQNKVRSGCVDDQTEDSAIVSCALPISEAKTMKDNNMIMLHLSLASTVGHDS